MNKRIWTDAINNIDEDMVEEYFDEKMRISPGGGNNTASKGGNSMNPNSGRKKWVITIVIAAILIAAAVAVAILAGPGSDDPVIEQPKESSLGVYYYDTAEGEYLLTLSQGNVFMISGPSLNKSGKCVVTDDGIELDFVKDEDGTGSLKEENGVMVLQYKDKTMRFLEKKTFKVNFNVNGGSEVAAIDVVNGKTVSKPADPKKDGSVFIGWYADEACTELYGFGNEVITADTTVYAKWAETVVGQNEYTVNFDLGYEAEGYEAMSTIGGKLYNVPTPTRDGYTFAGWWVSQTQNAEQLTIPYVEDMVFQANTTLFALWTTTPTAGKLAAPMVEVYADSIKWNTIQGASTYELKIFDANGEEIHSEKLGATTKNFDFATREAGEYTIQVTALASVEDKNSETTTRTFVNKALDRVSLFTVIDGGILLWNGVEGAEKYLITIDCGNDAHKHTAFDNGDSTTFMFKNCAMQEGGIKFTVTAVADGKASSVSETFVYDRKLDAVGEILYNEETQSFYWDAVANAAKYSITVKVGDKTFTVDNGSATTFSAKYLSGDITLEIVPMTQGYNSPEATTTTYKKTSLATPEGLMVKGNILTWKAVEGATGYMVKINNQSFQAAENSLDLTTTTLTFDSSTTYDICVMAVGTESSLYSDVVTMKYLAPIEQVTYKNNTVTWTPVMGVENYEVRVNGGETITVSGANFTKVTLTKAGINTIEVRYTDLGGSIWTATEVFAYEVIYNSRSLSGTKSEYLAMGDTMTLPQEFTQDGYDFTGWYNAPEAANGNGAACADTTFTGTGTTILYANWTPKVYQIEFVGMTGVTNIAEGDKQAVTYKDGYVLPIPEVNDEMGEFMGWYTGPGGSGVVLTDAKGNSLTDYAYTRDAVAYPAFNSGVLEYILQSDGTYAVTAGPNIKSTTTVTIPECYKDVKVTAILENAFYGVDGIERIVIPATIRNIGVGAIPNYVALKEIEVYTDTIQQNYEVFYSSHDGALLKHDMGAVYLEVFPRGKTGEYTIPDNVDIIRDNVFRYAQITRLIVGNGVYSISRRAFYRCEKLEMLEFKGEGTVALTIDPEAFFLTTNLTVLRLPARLAEMDLKMLDQFANLTTIEVEAGGILYSSMNNMLCDEAGTAILYTPFGISGEFTIPVGVRKIGAQAFANRVGLTKVVVPGYVNEIGDSAFLNCTGITEVVIEGSRSNDLVIGAQAFSKCKSLSNITFQGNNTGKITLGNSAFASNSKMQNPVYEDGVNIAQFGAQCFSNCVAMTEAYIPASVTSVGNGAFSGCEGIQEVTFAPNGQQIAFGSSVFADCKSLTTVNLPATIGSFDGTVFAGCETLSEIIVDEGNPNFVTYGGALYSAGYEEILFYPRALDGDLSKLHPNLKKIGATVFQGNPKVTKYAVPANITEIGNYAFDGCTALTEVTFAEGSTAMTIGNYAFRKCTNLTGIALPACTTEIGEGAFESAGLTSFVIPNGVTVLNMYVLSGSKIKSIEIPANVETVCDAAFANCSSLTTVTFAEGTKPLTLGTLSNNSTSKGVFYGTGIQQITLGDRVTVLGAYAFYNQKNLQTVTMTENSQLTEIGQNAFQCYSGSKLTKLTLGPKVKTIHKNAFYGTMITSLYIPKSVTMIDMYAFQTNTLTVLEFEMGGTEALTLGNYAFSNTKIEEVTLPKRLTNAYTVGVYSSARLKSFYALFNNNSALKSINVEEGNPYFKSIDGILYELNKDGVADTLLFCPPAKTGDVIVSKDVRRVEHAAFYNTSLSSITFEEYDKADPNYGQPLLELGDGYLGEDIRFGDTYAVFSLKNGQGNLTKISLPSHLKSIGVKTFYNLNKTGITITFNQDAHLTVIQGTAFDSCTGVAELALPAVDELGITTFNMMTGLSKVTFGADSKMTVLPQQLFNSCTSLASFEVPATVTRLDTEVFLSCTNLKIVTFAEGTQLRAIGNKCFSGAGIVELVLPDTVETLGEYIFQNCANLKTVTLSAKLITLTSITFYGSTALESIYLPADNAYYKAVDGVLYDVTGATLYAYPTAKNPTGWKMQDTVRTIAPYAMAFFSGTTVELPESLETIGANAFEGSSLSSIHIPGNVISIGAAAFSNAALQTLTFAEDSKLKEIGGSAFMGNANLVSVKLPDSVTSLGQALFARCTALEEVILPAGLKVLPAQTFNMATSLKKLVMQEGLTTIEDMVVGYTREKYASQNLAELVIPSTVTTIGRYAFACLGGVKTLTFAANSQLETLGMQAFYGCKGLESLKLPAKLKTFGGNDTTWQQDGVSVTFYTAPVFGECTSLKHVDMSACVEMTTIPSELFQNCAAIETLLLPPNITEIGVMAFGARGNYSALSNLKEITIPASVTSIGSFAFNGCTNLKGITVPAAVTSIGDYAFNDCTGLKEITISAAVTSIGSYAFNGCAGLEGITIPAAVTSIGDYAFNGCIGLKEITIPAAVTSIGGYAFNGCTGLEKVIFAEDSKLTQLGVSIFAGTTSLKTVDLPKNLTAIGAGCFEGSSVESIELPSVVTAIGARAFKNCVNIVDAGLTANLVYLGDEAFYGCEKLEKAELYFGLEYLGARAFGFCQKLTKAFIPATIVELKANPFMGCTGIQEFTLDPDNIDFVLKDGVLYDAAMSTLICYPANLTTETFKLPETVQNIGEGAFAGAKLKEIFIEGTVGTISANAFAGLVGDVNIYFTGYTQAEIVAAAGDAWLKNASEKAHFFFKDTIPTT